MLCVACAIDKPKEDYVKLWNNERKEYKTCRDCRKEFINNMNIMVKCETCSFEKPKTEFVRQWNGEKKNFKSCLDCRREYINKKNS